MVNNSKQITAMLFMAVGIALSAATSLDFFVIVCALDFTLFAIATHLKEKILLDSTQTSLAQNEKIKRTFIFMGEEIKHDESRLNDQTSELTPDERYIVLASSNLQIKRFMFSVLLSFAHMFFTHRLGTPPIALMGSSVLFLATVWIFFRIWRSGQFQLVMFMNWCGAAFLARGNASFLCMILPFYVALSFHLLQKERDYSFRPSWSISWSYTLKLCSIWGICLILMGSLVPNQLLNSLTRQLQNMNRMLPKNGLSIPPRNTSTQSMQQLASSLEKQINQMKTQGQGAEQTSNGNSADDIEQLKQLQSEAKRLAEKMEQEDASSEELAAETQQFSQKLSESKVSPGTMRQYQASLPQAKKEKNWDHLKNILIKISILLLILLVAKLLERRAETRIRERPHLEMVENFKKKWKALLASRLNPRTFVLETYQLLAEANQAFFMAEKAFCPPLIVYRDVPHGLYQKEWPTVAKSFLRTFYGDKDLDHSELKLFTNSADRLFSVYFTKSLDRAITSDHEKCE